MREIKFRAFDELGKIMHYDFQFIKTGDKGEGWIFFISDKQALESDWRENPFFFQQFKIMQYTGIKDEKGKDIYEGDIVQYYNNIAHISLEVFWNDENASFFVRNFGVTKRIICAPLIEEDNESDSMKIIGNIHENPELLDVKND